MVASWADLVCARQRGRLRAAAIRKAAVQLGVGDGTQRVAAAAGADTRVDFLQSA